MSTELANERDVVGINKLSKPKHEKFVRELLLKGVSKLSIIKAYYSAGFNPTNDKVALVDASELLSLPSTQERLKYLKDQAWNIVKPTTLDMYNHVEKLAKKKTTSGQVKLACFKEMSELAGLKTKEKGSGDTNILLQFNGMEMPVSFNAKMK